MLKYYTTITCEAFLRIENVDDEKVLETDSGDGCTTL